MNTIININININTIITIISSSCAETGRMAKLTTIAEHPNPNTTNNLNLKLSEVKL